MADIAELLAGRQVRPDGAPGDSGLARKRFEASRAIGEAYADFNPLRLKVAKARRKPFKFDIRGRRQGALVERLEDTGLLRRIGRARYVVGDRFEDADTYLMGRWLEELGYFAVLEAGADEAAFGQVVRWRVGEVEAVNEIDVLARRGEVLSFTSCKALHPELRGSRSLKEALHHHLLDLNYWDQHFAGGAARAVLMVTTDLIDEARRESRLPALMARATVLDVDVLSLDMFRWDRLVQVYRDHWAAEEDLG